MGRERSARTYSGSFPRRRAEFEGRIHEQLSWKEGPAPRSLKTGVSLDHTGYDQAIDDPSHKAYRNIPLLQAALRDEPNEHYYHYQLGRAHFSVARYEQAIGAFESALGLIEFRRGADPVAGGKRVARETLTTALVSLGYALINTDRLDAAHRLLEKHRRLGHAGTRRADFEHLCGYVGLMRGDMEQARSGYLSSLELGPTREDVRGTGSHSSAYHLGLLAEIVQDAPAATRHYAQALAFESDFVPALSRYIDFCVENAVESTTVEISVDGRDYVSLGTVRGSSATLDIDGRGRSGARYRFVRLTDDPGQGDAGGSTPGADIDAVGAIHAERR